MLQVLDSTPSPRGRELATALVLRDFCATRWPTVDWQVQRVGTHGANLAARHGGGALLYSHLDTSLDTPSDVGPLRIDGNVVDGFGLAVARGPAAAALVAFAGAGSGTLLLASSGTHRRGQNAAGMLAWLAANPQPPAAVVAKCGPPGVLWSEPGALYLTVRITGRPGVVMLPASPVPPRGLPERLGGVLSAVSSWCSDYVASQTPVGQLGAAAGIGAIRAGLPDKADLYPGEVEIVLYVVALPGAQPNELAASLARRVSVPECTVTVVPEPVHDAATTDRAAPIVVAACAAWTREFGAPGPLSGWTGSTDGVVLRGHGIDAVRLGPQPTTRSDDPRRDVLRLDQLEGFVRVYRELLG